MARLLAGMLFTSACSATLRKIITHSCNSRRNGLIATC